MTAIIARKSAPLDSRCEGFLTSRLDVQVSS